MAFLTGKSDPSNFSRISAGEFMALDANTATPDETGENFVYTDGTDLFFWNGSSSTNISSGGGSSPSGGLDDAYSIDRTVTVDEGAAVWTDSTTGSANTWEFVKDGAGSGNVLDFSIDAALTGRAIAIDMNLGIAAEAIFIDNGGTARTASDILVTDDSTGDHSVIDINSSGSGATVGFDFTGSNNGSPGGSAISLTFDNTDNLDTNGVLITRGTGVRTAPAISIVENSTGSADIINIDVAGVYTGDAIDITTSAAATGNMIFVNLDSAVAATALHVEGSGVRTQPYLEMISDATGAVPMFDINVTAAYTGNIIDITTSAAATANALFVDLDSAVAMTALHIEGSGVRTQPFVELITDCTGSANMIQLSANGAFTGDFIALDMDAALGANGIFLDNGGGIRTAPMILATMDGAATGGGATLMDVNVTGTGAGANPVFDIDVTGVFTGNIIGIDFSSAAATGDAIALVMGTNLAGSAISITAAGARTDDLIKITDSSTSNSPMFDINVTGVNTGNILDIAFSASAATGNAIDITTGTNLAGNAMQITTAGVRTAPVINIVGAATDGGTDDHIFFVTQSGLLDSNLIQLTYDTAASTGDAINIVTGTNLAGQAIAITTAGVRTGPVILVTGAATDGGTDDHIIDINQTGLLDSNVLDITYSSGVSTGNAIDLNMGTNVAGMAISVSSAGTGVSGEGSCFDVAHTGDLVAGADAVRISSTGSPSSTSNLLSIVQATGAGTAGAYGLHVACSGTNVEAAHFETGEVYVQEALRFVQKAEVVTAANVITADESGSVFFLNAASEFASTLPAPSAGLHFTFIVTAAPSGASYTITTNASANIILGYVIASTGGNEDSETSGADTINFVDGTSTVGDMVQVWCDGTNWFALCTCDATGAITITTAS